MKKFLLSLAILCSAMSSAVAQADDLSAQPNANDSSPYEVLPTIKAETQTPFEAYDSYQANGKFYYLKLRGKWMNYDVTLNQFRLTLANQKGESSKFQFVKAGGDTYKIFCKSQGGTKALGGTIGQRVKMVDAASAIAYTYEENGTFKLFRAERSDAGSNAYLNDAGELNYLGYWRSDRARTDQGSNFEFVAVEEQEVTPQVFPTAGKFFRMMTTKNGAKYVSSELSSDARPVLKLTASQSDESTIFYRNEAGNFVAFKDGKHVGLDQAEWGRYTTKEYGQAGAVINVTEHSTATGYYLIETNNRYLHGVGDYTDTKVNVGSGAPVQTDLGYRFKLEEVKSLPLHADVTLGSTKFGSFYAPVGGTLSGDKVVAYTAKVNGTNVSITPIEGLQIPAKTAFLFTGENVKFNIDGNKKEALTNNALVGYDSSTTTGVAGDWGLSMTYNDIRSAEGIVKRAFRAFITGAPANAQALTIDFGTITAIDNVVLEGAENAPLYDLSGRRVTKANKGGIYVQGGKKIVF